MTKPLRVLTLGIVFLILPFAVRAQTSSLAALGAVQTESFPQITALLDVRDERGQFAAGLRGSDVTVLENGQRVELDKLEALRPGVQFVVAINAGTAFSVRDAQGISRYDRVKEALETWAAGLKDSSDDLSLLTNAELSSSHLDSASKWLNALFEAPSDHRNSVPNFQLLSQAIGIASDNHVGDSISPDGRGRAVLFITQIPEQSSIPALENLAASANQAGVPIYVWMVASKSFFVTSPAIALQELAISTGGQFFAFSGEEPFPDIESYLEPRRNIYAITYTSQIRSQGMHELAVEIKSPAVETITTPSEFELTVLPPNPILVSPPNQIYRALVSGEDGEIGYDINQQQIEILLEFQDGIERALTRTTLYVDGQIVAENTRPPFDVFSWDLSSISESGRRVIQVEAVDEFGLSQITIETPVEITVQQRPEGIAPVISENSELLSVLIVLMSGIVLGMVLLTLVRSRTTFLGRLRRRRRQRRQEHDPVYQPVDQSKVKTVPVASRKSRLPRWASQIPNRLPTHLPARLPWSQRKAVAREPYAYLEQVFDPDSLETFTPVKPIPISKTEFTLGVDPSQSSLVLDDPSVAELHARLRRDGDGNFFVQDNDSIAGTWVNYVQTNSKEVSIEHGDLLHFGRVGFRFKLNKPPRVFEPLILRRNGNGTNGTNGSP